MPALHTMILCCATPAYPRVRQVLLIKHEMESSDPAADEACTATPQILVMHTHQPQQ